MTDLQKTRAWLLIQRLAKHQTSSEGRRTKEGDAALLDRIILGAREIERTT